MTVKELIKYLKQFDPNLLVVDAYYVNRSENDFKVAEYGYDKVLRIT